MKKTCSKCGQEIKKFSTEELITRLAGKSDFLRELLTYWVEERAKT